jgi:hypothetical protein
LNFSKEDKQREEAMKQFYESKINQLTSQIHVADSKALEHLHNYQQTIEELKRANTQKDELQAKLSDIAKSVSTTKVMLYQCNLHLIYNVGGSGDYTCQL